MSSYTRNLQRKFARKSQDHEPRGQVTINTDDGGYITVRYTRGLRKVSAARLRAQAKIAELNHFAQATMLRRLARGKTPPRDQNWLPKRKPVAPGRVTRQQRRSAELHPVVATKVAPQPVAEAQA